MSENSSKEYDDSMSRDTEKTIKEEKTERFQVNIPDEEISELSDAEEEIPEASDTEEKIPVPSDAEKKIPVPSGAEEKKRVAVQENTRVKSKITAKIKAETKAETKGEKKARRAVIILSCFMAVITVAVAVLGGVTDIFRQGDEEKAVAVLILPQDDKEELEKNLSKLWPLAETGFDTDTMSAEEIFGHIRPYGKDGLYTSFGYSSSPVTDEADPAMRFGDENAEYSYYKIPADEIDSILIHFGLETNHALNNLYCYYYDSYYYFDDIESSGSKNSGKVTIQDSKRIQDGRYYVEAKFGSQETYVIASIQDNNWEINSMSTKPVFDSLGIKIRTEDDFSDDYEMRSLVIEGKADDGTVYRKYNIKYPYFFGDTQGEVQANAFYQSIITFYQQQSEQVQSDYKKFIKKEGRKESLPIELHYTAEVSYSDEEKLCLINEIVESLPLYNEEPTETTEENYVTEPQIQTPVVLPKKTIECYTFDLETGAYVGKDSLIGKDHNKISEILYRIYCGYSYADIFDETLMGEEVPEDTDGIGEKIYNSALTICEDGYVFCLVTDEGLREDVVIPFDVIDKLKETTIEE